MRLLALILLLGNLGLWAYMDYVAPRFETNALTQQVHPERLRLVNDPEEASAASVGENAGACIEFGPLDDAKLTSAKEVARAVQSSVAMAERRTGAGSFLELRAPSDAVRKQLGELLIGVGTGTCAIP